MTLLSAACAGEGSQTPAPDAGSPDAAEPDVGDGGLDASTPDVSGAAERLGGFLPAPTGAVLSDEAQHLALIGTIGAQVSPFYFGRSSDPYATETRGGLVALDTEHGTLRVYGTAEGLPEQDYLDDGTSEGVGPAPFLDLTWIEKGTSFASASWGHVVRGDLDEAGAIHFRSVSLRRAPAVVDAFVGFIAYAEGELFVGTDQGFAALDAETLALKRWYALGEGAEWARGLRTWDGDRVLALAGPLGSAYGSELLLFTPGSEQFQRLSIPGGRHGLDLWGMNGRALVAEIEPDGRGAIASASLDADGGLRLETLVDADALAPVSAHAFVPERLAYDSVTQRLYLGGSITIRGPVRTGGLAFVPMASDGRVLGAPEAAFDRRDLYTKLMPWEVSTLHADERGRVWMSGYDLCSETKRGVVGLLRFEEQAGERRLVRPWVSGVRAISFGPGGETWLGLRDEQTAMQCDGVAVEQALCRLRADGACEIYTPQVNGSYDRYAAAPGVPSLAFGDPAEHELAISSLRDATFIRRNDTSQALPTQFDPGLSLNMSKAAWGENGELWLATKLEWYQFPDDSAEQAAAVNRRSPQGLGLLVVGREARVTEMRRYTREPTDLRVRHEEIGGLPSSTVLDVLPLPGHARALVATGRDRWGIAYDHVLGEPAPSDTAGGIALIDDRNLTLMVAKGAAELDDVVALAAYDGHYYALEAAAGLLQVDVDMSTVESVIGAPWTAPERALALAIDEAGHVAIGTNQGLWTGQLGGALEKRSDALGFVWAVRFDPQGRLYVGADEGLLRIDPSGAPLPAPGPSGLLAREPWPLPPGCNGELGCGCFDDDMCAAELACLCNPQDITSCSCAAPPPPSPDCSNMSCACTTDDDCPPGWICQGGIAGNSCVAR